MKRLTCSHLAAVGIGIGIGSKRFGRQVRKRFLAALALLVVLGLTNSPLRANTYTWNSAATGPAWSVASNWSGAVPVFHDIAQFAAGSYNYSPANGFATSLGEILDTGVGAVTITGSALTLDSAVDINGLLTYTGIKVDAGAGALTISASIVMGIAKGIINNSAGTLTFNGNIGGNVAAFSGSGAAVLNGTNNIDVLAADIGAVTLGQGSTTCNELSVGGDGAGGVLNIGTNASISAGLIQVNTGTTVNQAGTVTCQGADPVMYVSGAACNYNLSSGSLLANSLTVENFGRFNQTGGTANIPGLVSLSYSVVNLTGGLLLIGSNGISNDEPQDYVNLGGGTLGATAPWSSFVSMTLTGSNGNATIDTTGGNITLGGGLSGAGGMNKIGPNTLTLSGSNSYSGTTAILTGTLEASTTAALPNLFTPSKVRVASGAVLAVLVGGSQPWNGSNIALLLSTSGVFAAGASLGIDTSGGDFEYYFSNITNSGLGLVKLGPNTLSLFGTNSYSGGTIISGGTLFVGSSAALGSASGALTINSGMLELGNYSVSVGALSGGGTIDNPGTQFTPIALSVGNGNATSTFSGTIQNSGGLNSGPLSLTKAGSGVLTLAGKTTLYGNVTVEGGVLTLTGTTTLYGNATVGGGTLAMPSGSFSSPILNVGGYLSMGRFVQSGGVNAIGEYDGLSLGDYAGYSSTYTLNGGLLVLSGLQRLGGAGSAAFNFSGGTLQAGGSWLTTVPINLATSGGNGTFDTNGKTLTLAGSLSGPGGLTTTDSGTLVLALANTFSGSTTISGGTLQVGDPLALQNSSVALSSTGGILNLNSYSATLGGLSGNGNLALGSGTLSVGNNGSTTSYSGVLSGAGGLTKIGTGTLILIGSNTYSGGTLISGGTLQIGNALALQDSTVALSSSGGILNLNGFSASLGGLSGNGNLALGSGTLSVGNNGSTTSYSGILSGAGGLTKIGSGTLTLSGPNVYSGGTTVSAGILQAAALNGLSPNSNVSISGGTLDATLFAERVNSISVSGGALNLTIGNILTSNGLASVGGTLDLFGATGGTLINCSSLSGSFSTVNGIPAGYFLTYLSNQLDLSSNPGWKAAVSGNWSMASNWTGGVPNAVGASAAINVPTSSPLTITLDTPVTVGTLLLGNSSASTGYTLAGSGSNTLTFNNAGAGATITVANGTHAINAPVVLNDNLVVAGGNSGWTLSFGSAGGITGNSSLTMSGGGTLILSAANTFSGSASISGGTLQIGNALALQDSTAALLSSGGSLNLNGYSATLGGLSGNGNLALGSGTLSVGNNGSTTSYSGILSGAGGLAKIGSGTLILSGSNSYTGGTTISGGTLQVGNNAALGSSSGALTVSAGLLDIHGCNVSVGALGGGGTIDNLLASGGALTVGNGNATSTFSGAMQGSIGGIALTKLGSGMLTLTGINRLDTTVNGGTLALPGGYLSSSAQHIGFSGAGSFTQSGGTNSVSSQLALAVNQSDLGTYNLSGSGLLTAPTEYIGIRGSGSFTQSGGTNSVSIKLYLADNGGFGTYNLSGSGLLTAPTEYIGYSGSGSFTQSGGTNSVSSQLYLDVVGGDCSGIYNLSGSGLLTAASEYVGLSNTGSFTQTGGTHSVSNELDVGYGTLSIGTYSLSGGSLSILGNLVLGNSGSGAFTQTGGTNSISNKLELGYYSTGSGTYNLNGGLLFLSGSGLLSGAGSATFNFSGGTLQAGNSWLTSMPITLATSGSNGTIDTNGNTLTLAGSLSGPGGLVKANSGTLILSAANTYSGRTTISGGTLQVGNPLALQDSTVALSSTGGNLTFSVPSATLGGLGGNGNLALGSGTLSVGNNGSTTVYAGNLTGGGSLVKIGSGGLTLSGSNTYAGVTTISGGILVAANTLGSATGTGPVTVGPGATLGGTGFIAGPVTVTGGSAGNQGAIDLTDGQIGTLTLSDANSGDTALTIGGTAGNPSLLKFDAGASADRILIPTARLAVAAGRATISITPLSGFGVGTYDLIDFPANQASGLGNLTLAATGGIGGYAAFLQSSGTSEQLVVSGLTSSVGTSAIVASSGTASATVAPNQPGNGSTGTINATLSVSQSGTLTNNFYETTSGNPVAQNFGLTTTGSITFQPAGNVYQSWDLQYSGQLSGTTSVTFNYDPVLLGAGFDVTKLQISHYNSQRGVWETPPQTNNTSNDTITVTVTSFSPFVLAVSPDVWNGQANSAWDTSSANWSSSGINVTFSGTEAVVFDDTAGTAAAVVLNEVVQPQGVLFNNSALNYTLSGSGDIGGSANLTKAGSGLLTLATANTYTGGTTVSAGILQAGNNAALGDSAGALAVTGGTLDIHGYSVNVGPLSGAGTIDNLASGGGLLTAGNGDATSTFAGTLQNSVGQLSLTKLGSGGLTLTGPNAISGSVIVDGGTLAVPSGSLASPTQYVGYGGTATFTQSGGTNAAGYLYVGYNGGSSGSYNLSNGLLNGYMEYVGKYFGSNGSFTQSGGVNSTFSLTLADLSPSNGSYNLTAGLLSATYQIVGNSGNGIFTQSGGTNSLAELFLGYSPGGSGVYVLGGSGLLTAPSEYVAAYGLGSSSGTVTQSGGTNSLTNGGLYLANGIGGVGTYNLSGSGLLSADNSNEVIGLSGTGIFSQSGGTNMVAGGGSLTLGVNSTASGTYNLNGGLLLLSSAGLTQGSGAAAFNFGGGTLGATAPWSSAMDMTLTGSNGNATIDATGGDIGLAGKLSGPGGLNVAGTGTLILSGSNSYSGGTFVDAGTLTFASADALPDGSSLTVGQDASSIFAPAVAGPSISAAPAGVTAVPGAGHANAVTGGPLECGGLPPLFKTAIPWRDKSLTEKYARSHRGTS